MVDILDHKHSSEDVDFEGVKSRFLHLNQARLQRARMALAGKQRDVLDLLPLLFHVNHPMLPGYAGNEVPAGVWGFEPKRRTLTVAQALAGNFTYHSVMEETLPIHAIYLMGSTGTVAHTEGSDFDLWLCHDPALQEAAITDLQRKASLIEEWALDSGLEIHFFFINAEEFRQGKLGDLTSESCGSAQHSLLLDEFYRTSVLLAGKYPLWWLVPPEYEAAYEVYLSVLQNKGVNYSSDCIDFGGLAHIPAEEFFGAALWQLSKGIDAPYKSILKLLLIEAYASEYPGIKSLSKRFKQSVYDGDTNPERLDPYLMMLEKVSDYLLDNGESSRLELARRCFYFKAGISLSEDTQSRRHDWRRMLLKGLAWTWNWTDEDLMEMDAQATWSVHRVIEERQILFEALLISYRSLSDFVRKYAGLSMISQRDRTTLGRKLYSAFERKAGKVDMINRGIFANLYEPQVTLCEVVSEKGENSGWSAYSGVVTITELHNDTPIKRARSLVELIAWCYFNSVIDERTEYIVYGGNSRHTDTDVEKLVANLATRFPIELLDTSRMDDYADAAKLLVSELIVKTAVGDGMVMTGKPVALDRTDPFRYGPKEDSLVLAIDHLQMNSWHELLLHRYAGNNNVLEALCDYLKWYPPSSGIKPVVPRIYVMGAVPGNDVACRIEGVFREVIERFYGEDNAFSQYYVLTIGTSHYAITFEGDIPRYEELSGFRALCSYLGRPSEHFTTVEFDERTLKDSYLPLIYANNKPGVVQLFYHPLGEMVDVFILDEKGSLFYQQSHFHDSATMLGQFVRFFDAASNRINFMLQEGALGNRIDGLVFYQLVSDAGGRSKAIKVMPQSYRPDKRFFNLQVLVEKNETGESVFTLYCDNKEFSTLEYGKGLFNAVVKHVLQLRRSGHSYPIYITDISLDRTVVGEENVGKMQTVHFLKYKYRIEEQLNRNM